MPENKLTQETKVTAEMLADHMGSGSLPVLATPMVAALFEKAAAALARHRLEEGLTTVGTQITVEHTAPTVCGETVTVEAELLEQQGRVFHFSLKAWDKAGPVASGKHDRVSVKSQRFVEKANERANGGK